ncbi:uncharacterized protein SCHCODRAFT_02052203 [Schizophyllum commune H4-8]|uniref:uncharacterized protein n=1 Tax=Schizophyllum commune (strain H4-8 / FGSC 9210) TaxID=578458 RepID=UPI00215E8565|nr:uncharacterized protein SCHCODRAFT_02052203 [Schizophyllum commune H4-8]KAI5888348.1 hypothetical protein SCHCODRAFT_02052203 [Schizophyllum commune H4-8]
MRTRAREPASRGSTRRAWPSMGSVRRWTTRRDEREDGGGLCGAFGQHATSKWKAYGTDSILDMHGGAERTRSTPAPAYPPSQQLGRRARAQMISFAFSVDTRDIYINSLGDYHQAQANRGRAVSENAGTDAGPLPFRSPSLLSPPPFSPRLGRREEGRGRKGKGRRRGRGRRRRGGRGTHQSQSRPVGWPKTRSLSARSARATQRGDGALGRAKKVDFRELPNGLLGEG